MASIRLSRPEIAAMLALPIEFDPSLERKVDRQVTRNRVLHLGLQCLLYMSREEEEPAEELIRQARTQGKRLLSAIVRAKFVDEYCRKTLPGQARVIASYVPEHEPSRTVAAQRVRGHWRRQPHGPGSTLRKLIWIQPYKTGLENPEPPNSPK